MHAALVVAALSGFALVDAQLQAPPPPSGIPIIQGSPAYDGPGPVNGTTGLLGNALVTTNNPVGVTYTATLPNSNTTTIRGYVAATSNSNGTGVIFNVNLFGFTDAGTLGPFLYHIHDQPVPADGNCTGSLGHLDPFVRGEIPPCDASHPETCQVGDLSGKHGNITTSPFQVSYLDLFASTRSGIGAFLGNRSINVHSSNTTRLTCANFTLTAGSGSNTTVTSPTGVTPPTTAFTGAAAATLVSLGAVAAGVFALLI